MKATSVINLLLISYIFSFSLFGNDLSPKEIEKKFFKKIVEIDEVFAQPRLVLDESRIYLGDKKQCMIYIFNKKDGKKINTVGKRGEGPGEFLYLPQINLYGDFIYLSFQQKLSIFTNDGKLIGEKRSDLLGGEEFIPFGNKYVYRRHIYAYDGKSVSTYLSYSLLDKNLKEINAFFKKSFYRPIPKDSSKRPLLFFQNCRKGIVYKDMFYLGFTDLGFYFVVIDAKGNRVNEINKEYDKIAITDDIKNKILKYYKSPGPEKYNQLMSHWEFFFPKYFPAFVNFFIHDDKIIVFKYPRPGAKGKLEVVLLDLDGKIIGEKTIFLGGFYRYLEDPDLISFYKGKIYYIINYEEKSAVGEFSLDELIKYYFKL